jgi:hypothetical protein
MNNTEAKESSTSAAEVTNEELLKQSFRNLCVTAAIVTKELSYQARDLAAKDPKRAALLLRETAKFIDAAATVLKNYDFLKKPKIEDKSAAEPIPMQHQLEAWRAARLREAAISEERIAQRLAQLTNRRTDRGEQQNYADHSLEKEESA